MKAMTLLLVLVAYGDSPDYLPAAGSTFEASNDRPSSFGLDAPSSRTRANSTRTTADQQQSRWPQPTTRPSLPPPLRRSQSIRRVSGNNASTNRVRAAQFEAGDNSPDRSVNGTDFDVSTARPESSSSATGRQFSLSAPGQLETSPQTDPLPRSTRSTGSRNNRYIPANASTSSGVRSNSSTGSSTAVGGPALEPRFIRDGTSAFDAGSPTASSQFPAADLHEPSRQDEFRSTHPTRTPNMQSAATPTTQSPTVAQRQPQAAVRPSRTTGTQDVPPPGSTGSSTLGQRYAPPKQTELYGSNPTPGSQQTLNQTTPATNSRQWERLAEQTQDATQRAATTVVDAAKQALPPAASDAAYQAVTPNTTNAQRYASPTTGAVQPNIHAQRATPGGSFMTTMLALFGSIGLNLYLGWVAWDTYNRYQDLVHDVRYTGSRREPVREEYGERVTEAAY